jgi:hypothetical protein
MGNAFYAVSMDCTDAGAMARFWAATLGRLVAEDATPDHAVVLAGDEASSGPRLVFNKVPEAKAVKNRVHFDLISDTFDAETQRLLSLGAQKLRDLESDKFRWTTFADIEGNEFDLISG